MEQLKQVLKTLNTELSDSEECNKYNEIYDLLKQIVVSELRILQEDNLEFCSFLTKLTSSINNKHPAKEISLKIFQLVHSYQLCEQFDQKELCKNVFEFLKHYGSEMSEEFLCEHLKFLLQVKRTIFVSIGKNYLLVLKEFFSIFFKEKYNCNLELKKNALLLLELVFQEIHNLDIMEVDNFLAVSILHEYIIPMIIDPEPEVRLVAIKAVKTASSCYTTTMHMKSPNWETFKSSVIKEYADVIMGFLSERNSDWYHIWCCIVRILGTDLHKGAVIVNCLLKIEETAFKSSVKEIRQQAFYCWQALVENFALDINELCSSKRMKLLLIPLQANNCRIASIALTKFNVWWCLVRAIQLQISKCVEEVLLPFLNFCFGSFSAEDDNSTELTIKPGRRYKSLMPYVVDAFIQIIGHQTPNCDCIKVTKLQLNAPILSDDIFKHTSKIIFESAVEATLCTLTFEKNPSKIVSCIWTSVLNFTRQRNVSIFNLLYIPLEKLAKNLNESHSDHRGVVLCTVFDIVLKKDYSVDKKFCFTNLCTTFFKNASNINFEHADLNKIVGHLSTTYSVSIIKDMLNYFMEYFDNSECKATFNVWLLVAKTIIENFIDFKEENILKMLIFPLLKKYFQFVICDWESLFKLSLMEYDPLHHINNTINKSKRCDNIGMQLMYKSIYKVIITVEISEKLIDEYIIFLKMLPTYDSSHQLTLSKDLVYVIKQFKSHIQYLKNNSDNIVALMILFFDCKRYSDGCEIFKNVVEILNFTNESNLITKFITELLKYENYEIETMLININEDVKKNNDSEIQQIFKDALTKYKQKIEIIKEVEEYRLNKKQALENKLDVKSTTNDKTNLKRTDGKVDNINFDNMPKLEKIEDEKLYKRNLEIMPELIKIPSLESTTKSDQMNNQIDHIENSFENTNNNVGKSKIKNPLTQSCIKKLLDSSIQKNIVLGHNLDTGSAVQLRGSSLVSSSPVVSSRTKTILKMSDSKTETKKVIKEHKQKEGGNTEGESFVFIKSDYKPDWEKLSTVQKERTLRKRDDIPSLYQDLTQSNSMDLFESNDFRNNTEVNIKQGEASIVSQLDSQTSEIPETDQCLENPNTIMEVTSTDSSNKILSEKNQLKRVHPIKFRLNGNDIDIIRSEEMTEDLTTTFSKSSSSNSSFEEAKSSKTKKDSISKRKHSHKKDYQRRQRELKRIQIDFVHSTEFPKTRTRRQFQMNATENTDLSIRTDRYLRSQTNVKNRNISDNQEHAEDNEISLSIVNLMHKKMSEELSQNSEMSTPLTSDLETSNADTESVPYDFQVNNTLEDNFVSKNDSSEQNLFNTQQNSNNVVFASNIISSPGEADMDGKSTEEFLNNTLEISPIKKNENDDIKNANNAILPVESQNNDSDIFSSMSLSTPKQSKRNEKIMNLAKKLNISEIKEYNTPCPEIIEIENVNGERHSDENFKKNIHSFKIDLLEFEKKLPSPLAKPEASIIKRKRDSDNDEMMPASKKKRVSFHDPPISSQVEYLPENFPKQLRSSKTARLPKKKGFVKQRKLTTRNVTIRGLPETSVDTVIIDGDDAVDYNLEPNNSKNNTSDTINLNFSLEDTLDIPSVNSSIESCSSNSEFDSPQNSSVNGKILDRSKPLYSPLISCQDDIKHIFLELVDPLGVQSLQNLLLDNHIETIGDLASLSAAEIRNFPLIKEKRTIKVLRKYEKLRQKIKDKEIRKFGPENTHIDNSIDTTEENNLDLNSTSPVTRKTDLISVDNCSTNKLNFTISKSLRTDVNKDLTSSFEICDFESQIENYLKKLTQLINSTSVKVSEDDLLQSILTRLIDCFGKERLYTALGTSFSFQYLKKYKTWPEIIEEVIQEAGFKSFVDSFSQMPESIIESRMDILLESIIPKLPTAKKIILKYHNDDENDENNEKISNEEVDPCKKLLQLTKKMPSHAVDNLIALIENMQNCNKT